MPDPNTNRQLTNETDLTYLLLRGELQVEERLFLKSVFGRTMEPKDRRRWQRIVWKYFTKESAE